MYRQWKNKKTGELVYVIGCKKVVHFKRAKHSYGLVRSAESTDILELTSTQLAKTHTETGKIFKHNPHKLNEIQELDSSPYGGYIPKKDGENYFWKS